MLSGGLVPGAAVHSAVLQCDWTTVPRALAVQDRLQLRLLKKAVS